MKLDQEEYGRLTSLLTATVVASQTKSMWADGQEQFMAETYAANADQSLWASQLPGEKNPLARLQSAVEVLRAAAEHEKRQRVLKPTVELSTAFSIAHQNMEAVTRRINHQEIVNKPETASAAHTRSLSTAKTVTAGRDTKHADTASGRYSGPAIADTGLHIVQDRGRNEVTIHDKRLLDKVPVVGDTFTAEYKGGRGEVSIRQASRDRQMTR